MISAWDPYRELTVASIILRFLLAVTCGAVIGFERSKNRHAAGLRTHIIVCIGASSVMILSQYLQMTCTAHTDPARLGAQVISGIGFLGAGTIVITGHHHGQRVKGLTTAAGLWASACMGLVVGSGFYEAAIMMCALLFAVIATLNRLDAKYLKDSDSLRLYIEYTADTPFSGILSVMRKNHWHMFHLEYPGGSCQTIYCAIVDVQYNGPNHTRQNYNREALLSALGDTPGVLYVGDA